MKSKHKRKFILVSILVLLIVGMCPRKIGMAAEKLNTVQIGGTMQPRYSNLQDGTLAFGIDGQGVACAGIVCIYYKSRTEYVQIRLELQQYTQANGWTSIYTTVGNFHENPCDTGFTRNVEKGYTYRAVATMIFYNGGQVVETVRLPSNVDTY